MNRLIASILAFSLSLVSFSPANGSGGWKPDQFLISLGWSLIFTTHDKPAYVASLKNLGLTTLMDNAIYFDLAAQNDLQIALYYDPTTAEIANLFKNNPTNWGYFQADEPTLSEIPYWAAIHQQVRQADPTRPSYTNIQSINYGVTRSYVDYFIDTVDPEILSFDFYQWYWPWQTLIENLEYYRKQSLEHDIPLMSWVEVDTGGFLVSSTTAARRRRYSTSMNLIYGVKGIWWFTADRIYNTDGTIKNATYYNDVQAINVELNNLGRYLVELTSTAVYHAKIGGGVKDWTGPTDPMMSIPEDHLVQISDSIPITLGMFSGLPGYDYLMISNRHLTNVQSVDLTFKEFVSRVEAFDAVANTWSELTINGSYPNQYVNQSLDQGWAKLLRYVLTPISLPGDYNGNGAVDAADYTVWRDRLGTGTSLPNDDRPGVGQDDYTRWRTHFGQTLGSGSGAAVTATVPEPTTVVPEPTTFVLLMLVAAGRCVRRVRAA